MRGLGVDVVRGKVDGQVRSGMVYEEVDAVVDGGASPHENLSDFVNCLDNSCETNSNVIFAVNSTES